MFEARRGRRVRLVRSALAAAVAAGLLIVVLLVQRFSVLVLGMAVTAADINAFLVGLVPIGKIGDSVRVGLNALLVRHPVSTTVAIGLFVGWLWMKGHAERLHDHALAEFDDGVLRRIRAPRAFDPLHGTLGAGASDAALPWTLKNNDVRRAVWDQALAFIAARPGRAADGGWWSSKPETPFGWTILLGRPGSGKSRLAVELARERGHRARFGSSGHVSRRERLSTWWRVQLRRAAPRADDPWDAGWLLPLGAGVDQGAYPGWDGRLKVGADPVWLGKLAGWRPRRPTVLLLDDPRPGDARTIIAALHAASSSYRHPVRMLVVNQSAPAELGLSRGSEGWTTEGELSPLAPPILLPDESRFTDHDLVASGPLGALARKAGLRTLAHMATFLEATRGNPLLVELGFKWLRSGNALRDMNRDALLTDRVDRVIEALLGAGLTEDAHHRAIAIATLAGGARDTAAHGGMRAVLAAYPLPTDDGAKLARIFPADTADLRNTLPPIRPETIGDAFVRRIVGKAGVAEQAKMMEAAWQANPNGTLRSAVRLGGVADEVGALLRAGPPDGSGVDPVDAALAFAEVGVRLPTGAKPESEEGWEARRMAEATATLCSAFAALAADRAMTPLLALGDRRDDSRPFLVQSWLRLVGATMGRTGGAPPDTALTWVRQVADVCGRAVGVAGLTDDASAALAAGWAAVMVPPRWGPEELVELNNISGPTRCDELTATFAGAVAAILPSGAVDPQLAPLLGASAHSAAAFLQRSAAAECRARAETVDEIAKPFPADRALQHERIRAWRFVGHAFGADLAQCHACAEIVDRIATPFPDDVGMQHERAIAWRYVAWAARHDPAQCRCYAERVDAIALPFPGHRDFAYERVQAWCYLVSATVADLGACHAHAETVDGIAAACPGDRDVQAIRIAAWGFLMQASTAEPARCQAYADTVDRIAAAFPEDRNIQLERAQAWRNVTYATLAQPTLCRMHAETVDRIATAFPDDFWVQFSRATAWGCVVNASTADASLCRAIAGTIDGIAALFATDRNLELERAAAWCSVACATQGDHALCRTDVAAVERIAAPYPDDPDFQRLVTAARGYL